LGFLDLDALRPRVGKFLGWALLDDLCGGICCGGKALNGVAAGVPDTLAAVVELLMINS
jgi:hypothetical protein